jgi:hypothetical protein
VVLFATKNVQARVTTAASRWTTGHHEASSSFPLRRSHVPRARRHRQRLRLERRRRRARRGRRRCVRRRGRHRRRFDRAGRHAGRSDVRGREDGDGDQREVDHAHVGSGDGRHDAGGEDCISSLSIAHGHADRLLCAGGHRGERQHDHHRRRSEPGHEVLLHRPRGRRVGAHRFQHPRGERHHVRQRRAHVRRHHEADGQRHRAPRGVGSGDRSRHAERGHRLSRVPLRRSRRGGLCHAEGDDVARRHVRDDPDRRAHRRSRLLRRGARGRRVGQRRQEHDREEHHHAGQDGAHVRRRDVGDRARHDHHRAVVSGDRQRRWSRVHQVRRLSVDDVGHVRFHQAGVHHGARRDVVHRARARHLHDLLLRGARATKPETRRPTSSRSPAPRRRTSPHPRSAARRLRPR